MYLRFVWRGIVVEIRHNRNFLNLDHNHIEIEAVDLPGPTLPVTRTGYRSHLMDPGDLEDYDSAVEFVGFWLETAVRR